jgi:CRISPR-associated exonuclease Cas4
MAEDHPLIVTDLKQFAYCPRVVFFERCLPRIRPRTYKMDAGKDEHAREQQRSIRRSLRQYGLIDGERLFDVRCTSEALGVTGIVDEVIRTPDGTLYPVDYKMAKRASRNHRLQVATYALLLETDAPHGYIYLMPKREVITVKLTDKLKKAVIDQLSVMRDMIAHERMPEATRVRRRCMGCEFRRFCNDIE